MYTDTDCVIFESKNKAKNFVQNIKSSLRTLLSRTLNNTTCRLFLLHIHTQNFRLAKRKKKHRLISQRTSETFPRRVSDVSRKIQHVKKKTSFFVFFLYDKKGKKRPITHLHDSDAATVLVVVGFFPFFPVSRFLLIDSSAPLGFVFLLSALAAIAAIIALVYVPIAATAWKHRILKQPHNNRPRKTDQLSRILIDNFKRSNSDRDANSRKSEIFEEKRKKKNTFFIGTTNDAKCPCRLLGAKRVTKLFGLAPREEVRCTRTAHAPTTPRVEMPWG